MRKRLEVQGYETELFKRAQRSYNVNIVPHPNISDVEKLQSTIGHIDSKTEPIQVGVFSQEGHNRLPVGLEVDFWARTTALVIASKLTVARFRVATGEYPAPQPSQWVTAMMNCKRRRRCCDFEGIARSMANALPRSSP